MQLIYQNFSKEGNGDDKLIRYPDLQALDKFDLERADTIKAKPTLNDSGFITYSNTIKLSIKFFESSGYLITQLQKLVKY